MNEEIEKVNDSRRARLVLDQLKPILDEQKREVINSIKIKFRQGTGENVDYLSAISTLCAFDDLENRLHSHINRGTKIVEEQMNARAKHR